jgi:peptide chain release factor 1
MLRGAQNRWASHLTSHARRAFACPPVRLVRAHRAQRRCLCSVPLQPSLAHYLERLVERHAAIEKELEDGQASFSVDRMRELSRLGPIVSLRSQLLECAQELSELRELAADKDAEDELREMALSELKENESRREAMEDQLVGMLVPPEEGEERGAILEVRAGVGVLEAGLFAAELVAMYEKFAKRRRWRFQLVDYSESDAGGIREASATIEGDGVYGVLRSENGTHRVQRVPATESLGRVHTSTAVVMVLPTADASQSGGIELNESDVKVDVFRASGAGGQHVNTTESAVRLTHKPTGIKVSCQNERSQHQNKAAAMKMLQSRVEAHMQELARAEKAEIRAGVASTGSRSERIRTYNFADDRVTDHRIGTSKFGLPRMLEGELLEEFTEHVGTHTRLERRREFLERLESGEE